MEFHNWTDSQRPDDGAIILLVVLPNGAVSITEPGKAAVEQMTATDAVRYASTTGRKVYVALQDSADWPPEFPAPK